VTGYLLVAGDPTWYYSIIPDGMAAGRDPSSSAETLRNTIYATKGAGPMDGMLGTFAIYLFTHNAQIAIFAFALGFAFAMPTILLLLYNGLMMGAMIAIFAKKGLAIAFVGWLAIHGTTEMFAIMLSGAAGLLPGFEQPTFVTTGWSQGQGAFGSGDAGGTVCPLDNNGSLHTTWNNTPAPTDMLLRKTFTLPSWWTTPLTVRVAIDNDIQVFVNGHNETASASSGYDASSGFVVHEGCATLDSFTFSVPAGDLVLGGNNLLAIRARDRGTIAYVDARVSGQ